MSFDVVVFAPKHVPHEAHAFTAWFEQLRGSADDFRYPNSENCVAELRDFFAEVKSYLPWHEEEPEASCAADYSFARHLIHCSFPWSCQSKAYDTILALCWRLQLGLYDKGGSGNVIYPNAAWDAVEARSRSKRSWWKFWRP